MRSKAPLAMLEQLVMLLVFALAAALCLQAFVLADRISKDSALYDHAVLDVQQAAEAVKHCGGDLQQAQQLLGGSAHRDCLIVPTENGNVTVTLTDSGHRLLFLDAVWTVIYTESCNSGSYGTGADEHDLG